MRKIGLIGYGYWGSIISRIILRQRFNVDIIFTSKKIPSNSVDCSEIIPISDFSLDIVYSLTHLFVLTGPPYHHDILNMLSKSQSIDNLPLVWLEKPFLTSSKQIIYGPKIENRLYVDYPYVSKNADPSFLQAVKQYQKDSKIQISIFSRHDIQRSFGVVFDFIPHIISLMRFFVKDFNSLVYSQWRVDSIPVQCPIMCDEYRVVVYSFEAISDLDGLKFSLRFGINNPQPSSLLLDRRNECIHEPPTVLRHSESSYSVNLADAFKAPVDQNIKRFLSANSEESLDLCDPTFHDLIYKISCKAAFEFSRIERL